MYHSKINVMIVTYKYYDSKKRRLAMKVEPLSDDNVQITIIACSKKDAFSRKFARSAFRLLESADKVTIDKNEIHPSYHIIHNSLGRNKWERAFFDWANENFYRHAVRRGFTVEEVLVKPSSKTLLLKRDISHKL